MNRSLLTALTAALGLLAGGCFTGVESTPRIKADGRNSVADAPRTAEETFLSGIRPTPPSQWAPGKGFVVTDNKIGRIFSPPEDENLPRRGSLLRFVRVDSTASLTGEAALAIVLRDDLGDHSYRLPSADSRRFDSLAVLNIPFARDRDIVHGVDSLLRGRQLFVRTPQWYSTDGTREAVRGLRHVEVRVDSVVPGTDQFPAAICFTALDNGRTGMLLINLTGDRADSYPSPPCSLLTTRASNTPKSKTRCGHSSHSRACVKA